jgi:hypothetical protein
MTGVVIPAKARNRMGVSTHHVANFDPGLRHNDISRAPAQAISIDSAETAV